MRHVLKVEDASKFYQRKAVVQSVSMQVMGGEIVGLLGANGAGKTTIFSILMGLVRPEAGKVFIDDKDISSFPMYRRAGEGIAYLPQENSIFRKLSVEDNIRISLEVRSDYEGTSFEDELERLLDQFHLQELRDHFGWSLSSGQSRRVEIARTLARKPLFVLLDEPFANIDPISIREVQCLMTDLCENNIGLIITDHNVQATLRVCDRAYIIDQGRIIASGNAEEIVANPVVRSAYLGEQFTL